MADTLTPNLRLTNQTEGGNNNTWGQIADTNFEEIDDKLGDTLDITTTGGTTTLSEEQERVAAIQVAGTLVANAIIQFSGRGGFWIVDNNTAGAFTLTCKLSASSGVTITQGSSAIIFCDGSDILYANPTDPVVAEVTVAAATTTDVLGAASEFVAVSASGNPNVTSLGTGVNRKRFVRATGAFTLVHHATTLVLPGGVNIAVVAGDTFIVVGNASSNARVFVYQRADGAPLRLANTIPGDATLSGLISFSNTGKVGLPGGTTAQRPASPAARDFRFNSTTGLIEFYDGTAWRSVSLAAPDPGGYLSLTADPSSPVVSTDRAAINEVVYAPLHSNLLPMSDGVNFSAREFGAFALLALVSNHLANTIYDVFAFDVAGAITLGTGPAWANSAAGSGSRGTGAGSTELTRLKGRLVNANQITARNGTDTFTVAALTALYLGSIRIDASAGQCTCHVSYGQTRRWGVWNAYNRQPLVLKAGDATSSWSYSTTSYRAANNNSANSLNVFAGLAEEVLDASHGQYFYSNGTGLPAIAIGVNSTSVASGRRGQFSPETANNRGAFTAAHVARLALGLTVINALEIGAVGATFAGTEADMLLSCRWRG